jgi:hypothetical protein
LHISGIGSTNPRLLRETLRRIVHEATNRARFGAFVISNEEENLTSINLLPLLRSRRLEKLF